MFQGKHEAGDLPIAADLASLERRVMVHPALGAPYGLPAGQRINLGRVGLGQTARVVYEPVEDEGSTT